MVEQGNTRMISPHHNVKKHEEGWDIDHDVIHIAPTCQNCVWHHMDSCTDNGDTVSVLGDEHRCVCNIEAATESAQNDIRAEQSSKTNNQNSNTTTDAGNATPEHGAEGECEYRRDNKPSTAELVSYWKRVKQATNDKFIPPQEIDWEGLSASVTQLLEDCINTRRHSRWGRVVWRDKNNQLTTAHTSDCYVRRKIGDKTNVRSVMWGVQLLRAIFGKSGLMDQLAEQRPALCQWELIVADRMSLTTNQRYDTEPTREDRHAYLTKDRDGPERNYNAELVRAAIQFDTNLMLQQTAETQFSKQQSDHNAAVEGVSYSVKDLSNELQIDKMKLSMSVSKQTEDTPTTREQVSSDIISELPTLDEDKETLVLRKRHVKEKAEQQDRKLRNNKIWESGDSPLPCLTTEDKATTAVADAYVKLRQSNEPVGAVSCPANTTIKIGTYNPQGCGGLVADEKNNSRFNEFMHTEKPDVFTMPEPQVPAGRARRLGHTSRYHTMINKYASNNGYTVFTTHHHSGRATHGVLMMVKEDIQVIKVERGLDEGHDEQWEGRVLAMYTEGICFLGLYMPHATAARDLLRDQIKAFIKRCDKKVILMTDINALATEDKSITVVHPKGNYPLVERFKPDYFTAEHEGQHVMFTKQRVRETNKLLEECGMTVLNDATENTTHFNAGFALHDDDKVLVKRLQEGDQATMSLYDRQRAMYCQGLRAKATIDVLALGRSASQSMTAHNVQNSMKDSDRTTKECHSACYQSDHSALTVEITLNESNMIRRSGITGSICSVIGDPSNYRAALLTQLRIDTRGAKKKAFPQLGTECEPQQQWTEMALYNTQIDQTMRAS